MRVRVWVCVCANDFGLYTPTNGIQIQGFDLAQHIFHILQNSNTCDTYSLYILSNFMPVRHTFACRVLWLPSLYCFQCKIYNVYRLYAPHSHSLSLAFELRNDWYANMFSFVFTERALWVAHFTHTNSNFVSPFLAISSILSLQSMYKRLV